MSYEELRSSVSKEQNTDLKNPGKIYFKDNYIFIVEELRGYMSSIMPTLHLRLIKHLLKSRGWWIYLISGSVMYADSYVDLVVLDVQDVDNIHETGRIKDVLPYPIPPAENNFPIGFVDPTKGVVAGWEVRRQ